jgi:ACS family 4-hydroxyphenylacetate permease-like MFS transporter
MIVWAGQSDRRRERPGHFAIAMVLCCAGFVITGLGTGKLAASIVGLAAASSGAYAAMAIFWTAPQAILAPHERPGGIAAISLIGITAGMISPIMVGHLREASGGYGSAMLIASAGAIVSAVAFWVAARMKSSPMGGVGATATSG